MKRPKIKLDSDSIKQFLINHVEKLVLGVMALACVFFLLKGFNVPANKGTSPKSISESVKKADSYIAAGDSWSKIAPHRSVDLQTTDGLLGVHTQLVSANYLAPPLHSVPVKHMSPRLYPEFFPPKGLKIELVEGNVLINSAQPLRNDVKPGIGRFPKAAWSLPDAIDHRVWSHRTKFAASETEFLYFNVVVGTAVIPHAEQRAAYEGTFSGARNYDKNRDHPFYAFVEVQRSEDQENWAPVSARVHHVIPKAVGDPCPEVISNEYLAQNISLPVPPLLDYDFRKFSRSEVKMIDPFQAVIDKLKKEIKEAAEKRDGFVGSSQELLTSNAPAAAIEEAKKPAQIKDNAPTKLVRFFDLFPADSDNGKTFFYRLRLWYLDPNDPDAMSKLVAFRDSIGSGNVGTAARGGGGGGRDGGGGKKGKGGGRDGGGGRGGGRDGGKGDAKKSKGMGTASMRPLTFEDLAAAVRNEVRNGNKSQRPTDIVANSTASGDAGDGTESASFFESLKPGQWIKCQESVMIPQRISSRVTPGSISSPTAISFGEVTIPKGEKTVQLVVETFMKDLGVFVPNLVKKAKVGDYLFFKKTAFALNPLDRSIRVIFKRNPKRASKRDPLEFDSETLLIDLIGGERSTLSGGSDRFNLPGEVLIMSADGEFVLKNDMDSLIAFQRKSIIAEKPESKRGDSSTEERSGGGKGGKGGGRDGGKGGKGGGKGGKGGGKGGGR